MSECDWCGGPFEANKFAPRKQRFCSRPCQVRSLYYQGRVDGAARTASGWQRKTGGTA